MEMGSRIRWAAVIVAIVLLLFGSIVAVTLIARNIFSSNTPTEQLEEEEGLMQYDRPGVQVTLEVQGPVVAKENRVAYRLTVGRTERVSQVFRGYDGFIEKEERLSNTEEAFTNFLKSIERAGFDRTNNSYENEDERGACATGRRFIYTIEDSGVEVFRAWRTSCGDDIGTSKAPRAVRTLFQRQFPNFSRFIRGLGLN